MHEQAEGMSQILPESKELKLACVEMGRNGKQAKATF